MTTHIPSLEEIMSTTPKAMTLTCLQMVWTNQSMADAEQTLAAFRLQEGFLGGRILEPSPSKPGYRVQMFFEDDKSMDPSCAGMRRVVILESQKQALGIT